jgi:hypothetical protein
VIAPIFPLRQADPALPPRKNVCCSLIALAPRDLRSETMRRLGAEVDCAADINEARCWWRPDLYNLVLMNVPASMVQTQKFCDDIRRFMPQQQIMFLVGKPDYLAVVPRVEQSASENGEEHDVAAMHEGNAKLEGNGSSQRWGIIEACRRISAVRSKMDARLRAMRDLPGPKRDPETSRPQRKNEVGSLLAIPELMEESQ